MGVVESPRCALIELGWSSVAIAGAFFEPFVVAELMANEQRWACLSRKHWDNYCLLLEFRVAA